MAIGLDVFTTFIVLSLSNLLDGSNQTDAQGIYIKLWSNYRQNSALYSVLCECRALRLHIKVFSSLHRIPSQLGSGMTTCSKEQKHGWKDEWKDEWKDLWKHRPLKIVTAGMAGYGKSSLINNFLGLSKDEEAKTGKLGKAVTIEVEQYEMKEKGVKVIVFDTPGLCDPTLSTDDTLEKISEKTQGEVDLLYYCVSLRVGRLTEADDRVLARLLKLFGNALWENTVFVMTFANEERYNKDHKELFKNLTEGLKKILEGLDIPKEKAHSITVAYAGDKNEELFYCGVKASVNWKMDLLVKSLNKAKPEAVPSLLQIKLSEEQLETVIEAPQNLKEKWRRALGGTGAALGVTGGAVGGTGAVLGGAALGGAAVSGAVLGGAAVGGVLGGGVGIVVGGLAGLRAGQAIGEWWVDEKMIELSDIARLKYKLWKAQKKTK